MFAEVITDISNYNVNKSFYYKIPNELKNKNIINKSAIRKQKCREQCNVYHLCNGGCLNESILAGGIENIPEFSCTAFSIIISHIKTRMQEAISRGIEFENIYNKYIRNIIKKRLEMNKNVK